MPIWLIVISYLSIALGIVTAIAIAADVIAHPQPMRIMNVVWPMTGLYFPVIGWWLYRSLGRPMPMDKPMDMPKDMPMRASTGAGPMHMHAGPMHMEKQPFWKSIFVSSTHCGAGCVLGDIIGAPIVFAAGWTLLGMRLFADDADRHGAGIRDDVSRQLAAGEMGREERDVRGRCGQNATPYRRPVCQTRRHFFLTPPCNRTNCRGTTIWPPTSRQAPPADRSTTLQAMTGFFGSTMMVAALDTKPIGRVRTNLRFSPTFAPCIAAIRLPAIALQGRVNSGLTTKTLPGRGQFRRAGNGIDGGAAGLSQPARANIVIGKFGRSGATSRRRV
jgi:Domain of unknown function (DUF4396)